MPELKDLIKIFKYVKTLNECCKDTDNTTYSCAVQKDKENRILVDAYFLPESYTKTKGNYAASDKAYQFINAYMEDLRYFKMLDPPVDSTTWKGVQLDNALKQIVWTNDKASDNKVGESTITNVMDRYYRNNNIDWQSAVGGGLNLNNIISLSKKEQSGFVPYEVYDLKGSYTDEYLNQMNSKIKKYYNLFGGFKKISEEVTGSITDLDNLLRNDLENQVINSLNKKYYKDYKVTSQTGGSGSRQVHTLWDAYWGANDEDRQVFDCIAFFRYRNKDTVNEWQDLRNTSTKPTNIDNCEIRVNLKKLRSAPTPNQNIFQKYFRTHYQQGIPIFLMMLPDTNDWKNFIYFAANYWLGPTLDTAPEVSRGFNEEEEDDNGDDKRDHPPTDRTGLTARVRAERERAEREKAASARARAEREKAALEIQDLPGSPTSEQLDNLSEALDHLMTDNLRIVADAPEDYDREQAEKVLLVSMKREFLHPEYGLNLKEDDVAELDKAGLQELFKEYRRKAGSLDSGRSAATSARTSGISARTPSRSAAAPGGLAGTPSTRVTPSRSAAAPRTSVRPPITAADATETPMHARAVLRGPAPSAAGESGVAASVSGLGLGDVFGEAVGGKPDPSRLRSSKSLAWWRSQSRDPDTSHLSNINVKAAHLHQIWNCDDYIFDKIADINQIDDDEFWFNTGFEKNMEDQGKSWKVDEEGNYQVKDLITGQTVDWDTDDKNNYKKQFNSAEKCFNSYLNISKDVCCDVIEKLLKGDGKEFLKAIGTGKTITIGALDENFKKQNPFSIKRILKSFKWPEILTWDPFVKGKLYKYPNFDYWAKNVLPNQDLEDSEVKTIKEDANLKAILNMCVAFVNHSPQLLNPHIDPFEGTPIDVPALKERGVHYYSKATANTFDGSWNHLHKRISKPYEKWSRNNSLFTTPIFSGDSFVLARGGGLKNKGEVVLTQTRVMPDFSTLIWEDLKHVLNNLKTMTNKTLKKNEIDDINKLLNNFKELEIQLLRKILTINKYVKVAYAMNDNKNEVVSINYIKQQIAQADEYFKEYSAKDLELKNVGFYLGQFIRDKL